MKRLIVATSFFLFGTMSAFAVCTKPSGIYVGSGAGIAYNTSGQFASMGVASLSLNITAAGALTITETGKTLAGVYNQVLTATAAANVFNATTCKGIVTLSNGYIYTYTSAESGGVVTFIYTKPDTLILLYNIVLNRV